jgi:hydroxypyruvate reductase
MRRPLPEGQLRQKALKIFQAALKAADPKKAVQQHLGLEGGTLKVGRRRYRLADYRHIYVIGAGKASVSMGAAVERILGPRITGGVIATKYGHGARLKYLRVRECGHPVPDEAGVAAAQELARIASDATEDDLVLALISGGASALAPYPLEPVTLADKQETTRLLLACGATIHEINAVRKHLSGLKGGRLAQLAFPATLIALILSDVIGDRLDVIGSGMTAPDPSTFADAWAVIAKYHLEDRIPASVRGILQGGLKGEVPETPKPGDPIFAKTLNLIIGSNRLALEAAAQAARREGLRPLILSSRIAGETRDIAAAHAAILMEAVESGRPVRPPACIISGGETTVTLRGPGKGGRNQEFVLAAAVELDGVAHAVVLSAGTDGTDGPTDAAGAIADGQTLRRAEQAGLDAGASLAINDSYHFFDRLGDLIRTGPTGTNVMDIHLLLAG